jgi:TolB-like protein
VSRRSLLVLAASLLPAQLAAQQQPDTRPGVAVLPFAQGVSIGASREDLGALGIGLQEILITELALNPAMRVVDRSVIRKLMEEQELSASGRVDAATAARMGKIVGAKYVFTGGFNDLDGQFHLDARIVDVETTEVIKAQRVTDRRERLYPIVVEMAQRLTRDVNLPSLEAPAREERQTRGATIPRDAVILYSQAQYFQDRGQVDRAKELYRRITKDFPAMTEAQEALRRIEPTGA